MGEMGLSGWRNQIPRKEERGGRSKVAEDPAEPSGARGDRRERLRGRAVVRVQEEAERLECKGGAHCGRAKRERLEVIPRENVTADEECARPRDEEREEGGGGEEERAGGEVVDVEERGEEKQQVEVCIGAR